MLYINFMAFTSYFGNFITGNNLYSFNYSNNSINF